MAAGDNGAVLRNAVEAWNRGDLDTYLRLYDDEVILHGLQPGIRSVRAMYTGMWRAYPGSLLRLDDVLVDGDKVACRYTVTGSARATGDPLTVPGITILHFRDGRCVERWDFEGTESNVT